MASIIHWLTRQPNVAVFATIVFVCVSAVVLAPFLARRAVHRLGIEGQSGGIIDSFKTVIAFTGVLLSFSLVQVNGNLRSAEELVVKEASAIANVDRAMLRFADPKMAAIRPALLTYARAIVTDEWPNMTTGRAEKVDTLYNDVSRPARAIDPATPRQQTIFAEIVRGLDDISDLRETRLSAATLALPSLFWNVIATLFTMLVILSGLIAPTLDRTLTLGGMIAAVAMLCALVVILDVPFEGDAAVKPAALERSITVMAKRV